MDMGRANPGSQEKFSMSVFALNTAQEANGVSKLAWQSFTGDVPTRVERIFSRRAPRWLCYQWCASAKLGHIVRKSLYEKHFGPSFIKISQYRDLEKNLRRSRRRALGSSHASENKLVDYIREEFQIGWLKNQADPSRIVTILEQINPDALLIGFSRRFATYKRAHLLFTDLDRLAKIVNDPKRPVQFIFAGKAHPADAADKI